MKSKALGTIEKNTGASATTRIFVGIPMTGLLRAEWVLARYGQAQPCNWSASSGVAWIDSWSPLGFAVAEARNLVAYQALATGAEWLFFLDHDVLLPPNALIKLNRYMLAGDVPIVNGLYFTKSTPAEPLIYRGMGNSYYADWKFGQKVWADGAGLGCTLIHCSLLRELAKISEEYTVNGRQIRRIFETPAGMRIDPETHMIVTHSGTEDLLFYTRLKEKNIYAKAGWPNIQRRKYPLLIDTGLYCKHIDPVGTQYPSVADESEFLPGAPKRKQLGVRWPVLPSCK